jgi:hypothetical protein
LRHFALNGRPGTGGPLPFAVWLEETYAALRGLARDAADPRQLQRLDRVRADFPQWSRSHGRTWADAFLYRHEIRASRLFPVPPDWLRIASDIPNIITLPGA